MTLTGVPSIGPGPDPPGASPFAFVEFAEPSGDARVTLPNEPPWMFGLQSDRSFTLQGPAFKDRLLGSTLGFRAAVDYLQTPSMPALREQGPQLGGTFPKAPFGTSIRESLKRGDFVAARAILAAWSAIEPQSPQIARFAQFLLPPRVEVRKPTTQRGDADLCWLRSEASHEYRNTWVALLDGALVASADSLQLLLERVAGLQLPKRPLIHRI